MSETCPVCGSNVETDMPACPYCGFKLLGSTQKFQPIRVNDDEVKAPAKPSSVKVGLRVVRGPQTGLVFPLTASTLSVGRSPHCDIFLNDMTVSRMHATLMRTDEGYAVADEHSFNGVWVNNENVEATRLLHAGDVIQIGAFCLVYQEERG